MLPLIRPAGCAPSDLGRVLAQFPRPLKQGSSSRLGCCREHTRPGVRAGLAFETRNSVKIRRPIILASRAGSLSAPARGKGEFRGAGLFVEKRSLRKAGFGW